MPGALGKPGHSYVTCGTGGKMVMMAQVEYTQTPKVAPGDKVIVPEFGAVWLGR